MAAQRRDPLASPCFSSSSLSPDTRVCFAERIWPRQPSAAQGSDNILDLDPYFDYVRQECSPAFQQRHAVANFEDIVFIVEILRGNPTATFGEVKELIEAAHPDLAPGGLHHSIELAVHLWLMSNARNIMPANVHQLQTSIPWPDDMTLPHVLNKHFFRDQTTSNGTFSAYLNFHDMKSIADVRVEWTSNLAIHLTMKGSVVYVFHCVSALKWMQKSSATMVFLPPDLIDETLATIDLLAPLANANCNDWLANEVRRGTLDKNLIHRDPPNRDKSRYSYWRERLLVIEETFDRSKPTSFFQWWYDRRDMQQWWGFWLIVTGLFFTVLFGLIQSVTGIIQVVKSSK